MTKFYIKWWHTLKYIGTSHSTTKEHIQSEFLLAQSMCKQNIMILRSYESNGIFIMHFLHKSLFTSYITYNTNISFNKIRRDNVHA